MRHDVYVRPSNNGFLATIAAAPEHTVEAATREEAIAKAQAELKAIIAQGLLVSVDVGETPQFGPGMWADNELFDEFQAAVQTARMEIDANPTRL